MSQRPAEDWWDRTDRILRRGRWWSYVALEGVHWLAAGFVVLVGLYEALRGRWNVVLFCLVSAPVYAGLALLCRWFRRRFLR